MNFLALALALACQTPQLSPSSAVPGKALSPVGLEAFLFYDSRQSVLPPAQLAIHNSTTLAPTLAGMGVKTSQIFSSGLQGLSYPALVVLDGAGKTVLAVPMPADEAGVVAAVKTITQKASKPKRPRGAKPSPRWKIAAAKQHLAKSTPASFLVVPKQLSYWLNDFDGDCVTAEEAFAKACFSLYAGAGATELFVPDATVQSWAQAGGYLNGADLISVMESMARSGFTVNGVNYTDGPYQAINWSDDATLRSAIMQGPVKLGVAGDQLENVVGATNGWVATGFATDTNEDHCVGLCGFGTMQFLCGALGVQVPSGVNASGPAYALFTWDTVGVIDQASMIAITSEAYVRVPTTPQAVPLPNPAPVPIPPGPTPPIPTPSPVSTNQIVIDLTGHTIMTPAGFRHSWGIKGDGEVIIHPALQTIVVPQNSTINSVAFPN